MRADPEVSEPRTAAAPGGRPRRYGWTGDGDRAERYARESLQLARDHGAGEIPADALFVLARLRLRAQRWTDARPLLEEAGALCLHLAEPRSAAQVLWQLGAVHRAEGDLDRALDVLRAAVAAIRSVGDTRGEARVLIELGTACADRGHLDDAGHHLDTAIELSQHVHAPNFRALALVALARVHERRGDSSGAATLLTDALRLCRDLGDAGRARETETALDRLRYPETAEP